MFLRLPTKREQEQESLSPRSTGLPSYVCVVCCATVMAVSVQFLTLASLNVKFRALKTDENEIKTLKIAAMLFNFVSLQLFC